MSESDAPLVARARQGDGAAFDVLVRRHLPAAHAVALALTGEVADAEDVCQDAFLTALERLEECRNPERFRAWLMTIVRNRAHNLRRYRDLRRGPPPDPRTASPRRGPDRETELALAREELMAALRQLPEVQREVVLLHDLEGWRHREIGETLGITEGSSRVHLHKARKALRRLLEADLALEE